MHFSSFLPAVAALISASSAQCPANIPPSAQFNVTDGYTARVLTVGLQSPRSIVFDRLGQLIVVEANNGLRAFRLIDQGGDCVYASATQVLVQDKSLNHGVEISPSGTTLYASSYGEVWAWDYDPKTLTVSNRRTIIKGLESGGHTSRTLTLSRSNPKMLLVSRGSDGNLDYPTASKTSGRSMIKSFDISTGKVYDYNTEGEIVGWGLRNEVGVTEHPYTTGIWGVENSADNVDRLGVDVHTDNPAEKVNFLGYMNGTASPNWGGNFGYPFCFAAWNTQAFAQAPKNQYSVASIATGQQFAMKPDATHNDKLCQANSIAPRIAIAPHSAPLDIKFDSTGTMAWVSLHGSWNRDPPAGYRLAYIKFANGQPVEPSTSKTALIDVLINPDTRLCPNNCFRPTGLVLDGLDRVYMTSDRTGEIWIVSKKRT